MEKSPAGHAHPRKSHPREKEAILSKTKRIRAAQQCRIDHGLSARLDCREGRFIQVGNSLLLEEKWQALTYGQRAMYLCMKMEAGGQTYFQFPRSVARKYGFHWATASALIRGLMDARFIRLVYSGKPTREPNEYAFIIDWKLPKTALSPEAAAAPLVHFG